MMFGVFGPQSKLIVDLREVAKIMGLRPSVLIEFAKNHDEWDRRKRIKNRRPYLAGEWWAFFDWVYAIVHTVSPGSKKLTIEARNATCEKIRQELVKGMLLAYFNRPLDTDLHKKP